MEALRRFVGRVNGMLSRNERHPGGRSRKSSRVSGAGQAKADSMGCQGDSILKEMGSQWGGWRTGLQNGEWTGQCLWSPGLGRKGE